VTNSIAPPHLSINPKKRLAKTSASRHIRQIADVSTCIHRKQKRLDSSESFSLG